MITTGPGGETIFPPAAKPTKRIPPAPDATNTLSPKTQILMTKSDLDELLKAERQAAIEELKQQINCTYHTEYEKHCNTCHLVEKLRSSL